MTRIGFSQFVGLAFGALVVAGALWGTRDAGAQIRSDGTPHTLTSKCCDRQ